MVAPENLLIVRHGKERIALDLASVREVLRMVALRHLPGAPAGILGVMILRGETIAVLDLEARLPSGSDVRPGIDHHLIVLAGTAVPLAVVVTHVEDVEVLSPEVWREAGGALPPGVPVAGMVRLGADPVAVLDPAVLLEKGDVMALREAMRRLQQEARPKP